MYTTNFLNLDSSFWSLLDTSGILVNLKVNSDIGQLWSVAKSE